MVGQSVRKVEAGRIPHDGVMDTEAIGGCQGSCRFNPVAQILFGRGSEVPAMAARSWRHVGVGMGLGRAGERPAARVALRPVSLRCGPGQGCSSWLDIACTRVLARLSQYQHRFPTVRRGNIALFCDPLGEMALLHRLQSRCGGVVGGLSERKWPDPVNRTPCRRPYLGCPSDPAILSGTFLCP